MVFGKQSRQGCESNRWHADGVRVENIHRNHGVGPPREDSKSTERPTMWTWTPHRQDHLRVNVQRHWIGSRRKQRKMSIHKIHRQLRIKLADSLAFIVLSCGLDLKRNGAELALTNPTDHGIELHRIRCQICQDPVIQYFVSPVPLREENYEAKEGEIHLNGRHEVIELLLRTVISANQLSGYGAIADLCNNLPNDLRALGKRAAPDHLEKMKIPTHLSIAEISANAQQQATLSKNTSGNSNTCQNTRKNQTVFWCGFEACRNRTILPYYQYRRRTTDATLTPRIYDVSKWKRDSYKRLDSQEYEDRSSLEQKFVVMMIDSV